ncbi:MAG: hypothetical protein LBO71_02750 [Prevotellaceae bacterium]|jgi:hypothetical protein|nr:hypothetical protein [Prevotellaceae bacterium]
MNSLQSKLAPLYEIYSSTIKPLIAAIEVQQEKQPSQLYNEIRAFNDHVARCYRKGITDDEVDIQAAKAMGHLERLALDCYKFLHVYYHDKAVIKFEKEVRKVDLSTVSNGEFYLRYRRLRTNIFQSLREAKQKEDDKKINQLSSTNRHTTNIRSC